MMTPGISATPGRPFSTEEDFKLAEWHPSRRTSTLIRHVVDAHALVRFLENNPKLGVAAKAILVDPASALALRVIDSGQPAVLLSVDADITACGLVSVLW
jgi:hypothetical protein